MADSSGEGRPFFSLRYQSAREVRLGTPALLKHRCRCAFTVSSAQPRRNATCTFESPSATAAVTSISRAVRGPLIGSRDHPPSFAPVFITTPRSHHIHSFSTLYKQTLTLWCDASQVIPDVEQTLASYQRRAGKGSLAQPRALTRERGLEKMYRPARLRAVSNNPDSKLFPNNPGSPDRNGVRG